MWRRATYWVLAAGLAVGLTTALVAWVISPRQLREELRRAGREYNAKNFQAARQRLTRLEKRWPGLSSVEYPLGLCAEAEGDAEAALAAWGRVTDNSPEATRARLAR